MNRIRKYIGNRSFYKMVLLLAVPIIVQNGITNFVGLLDNVMIGQVGTDQMSGVSVANQLMIVFNLAIFGGMSGAGIFGAQFFGKEDDEGIRNVLRMKLWIAVGICAVTFVIMTFFGEDLIRLFLHEGSETGSIEMTLHYGTVYLSYARFLLLPFAVVQAYASTLRETGQTVLPMRAGIVAVFVNLLLNWVLIFGKLGFPQLGVIGAVLATIIARIVEAAIVIVWTHAHPEINRFVLHLFDSLCVPGNLALRICRKGFPLLMNELLWATGNVVMSQCYSTRGLAVVAAYSISSTVVQLFNIVLIALGNVVGIIIGNLLGAEKFEEAKDTDRKLLAFSTASCTVIGLILVALAPVFPELYNTTGEVRSLAVTLIAVGAAFMPVNAFVNAAYFTLRSGGKTWLTFLFDGGYMTAICIPAALILANFTEIKVVPMFLVMNLLTVLKLVYGFVLVRKGGWVHSIVQDGEAVC